MKSSTDIYPKIGVDPALADQPINQKEILEVLFAYIRSWNSQQTLLRDKIRGNHKAVLHNLVLKYQKIWNDGLNRTKQPHTEQPAVYTNSSELATLCVCSERTVRDVITRLEEMGLLYKQFRGTKANYKVWISPLIVQNSPELGEKFAVECKALKNNDLQKKSTSFSEINLQTSPLKGSLNKKNKNIIIVPVDGVDKKISGTHFIDAQKKINRNIGFDETAREQTVEPSQSLSETISDVPSQNGPGNQNFQKVQTQTSGTDEKPISNRGGAAARLTTLAKQPEKESQEVIYQHVKSLVVMFWTYAKSRLFADEYIVGDREKIIQNLIWLNFFRTQEHRFHSTAEWTQYHDQLISRIDMVYNWLRSDSEHFIVRPEMYFKLDFSGGFIRTGEWYQLRNKRKIEYEQSMELQKAKRSIAGNLTPKGNPKMTYMELYQYWIDRLKKQGNPHLTEAFQVYVSSLSISNGQPQTQTKN